MKGSFRFPLTFSTKHIRSRYLIQPLLASEKDVGESCPSIPCHFCLELIISIIISALTHFGSWPFCSFGDHVGREPWVSSLNIRLKMQNAVWRLVFCFSSMAPVFFVSSMAPGVFCSQVWHLVFFVLEYGVLCLISPSMASVVFCSRAWRLVF